MAHKEIDVPMFNTEETVLQYVVDRLDDQIRDYELVGLLADAIGGMGKPELMAPAKIQRVLNNLPLQIKNLKSVRDMLIEQLIERRAFAAQRLSNSIGEKK